MSSYAKISKFRLTCLLLFFALTIIGRLTFPNGDEPDYPVRTSEIINKTLSIEFDPYFFIRGLVDDIDIPPPCSVESSPFSLWAKIDSKRCMPLLSTAFERALLTLFVSIPLFFLVSKKFDYRNSTPNTQISADAVLVALTFPATVYYISLFSVEQITLVISILIIFFSKNKKILIPLCLLIFIIDAGNALVVFLYLLMSMSLVLIYKKYNLKTLVIICIIAISLCYLIGFKILELFYSIPSISSRAVAMYKQLEGGGYYEKYPLVLRPAITYMTLIFMSANASIKVVAAYIISFISIYWSISNHLAKTKNKTIRDLKAYQIESKAIDCVAAITTILFFVILFPTYANGKYYIFLLPVFCHFFIYSIGRRNTLIVGFLLSITVFIHLTLYRL